MSFHYEPLGLLSCFVLFLITGFSGPMLWLQNCLNRTAEDREDDGKIITT